MSADELVASFSLSGISGGNAVFNVEKLDWMNGQYIARMAVEDLADAVRPFMARSGLDGHALLREDASFHRLLELLRPRARRLTEFADQARPLLTEPVEYEAQAVGMHLSSPDLAGHVAALAAALNSTANWDERSVEAAVRETAAARGVKAGLLIHAARVAVTGRTASPGLFELLAWLGRERTRVRLDRLQQFLAAR
jgi:glutamyl-tRNA synthetase